MAKKKKISRRKFLVRSGLGTIGVLAVGTYIFRNPIRRSILATANAMEMSYMGDTSSPMLWFEITSGNKMILYSPKVEMGQGSFTSMAQMAADELEIPLAAVQVVHAATSTGNIDAMSTGGSTSISSLWQPLRELAATLREMLKIEASKKLGVSISDLTMEDGVIVGNGKKINLTEVAEGVTEWEVPETPMLKDMEDYRYIGKPVPRVDLNAKVFGDPIFGLDAELPGMLYGAVVRPAKIGATFLKADVEAALKMPGVVDIIQEEDFVGVVARTFAEAENAKNTITVEWGTTTNLNTDDIEAMMTVGNGKSTIIQKEGNELDTSENIVEMEFRSPIGAHAQIEPNGVLASVEGDKAIVKISTQVVGMTRKEVAARLGFEEESVNVIPTYLGGGFGRRLHTPHAVQAAVMSKAVGKPVKYFFSRREEFQHDMFRPPTHHILKGKLNAEGLLENLEHHFVSGDVANNSALVPKVVPTILGADIGAVRGAFIQYGKIANLRTISWHVQLPFATSFWRSLGLLANTFAIESFIDQMALKAGKNPIDFRLAHIPDDEAGKRLKDVIKAASDRAGYKDKSFNGRAMGFAASTDAGTPCAQVAEISIENGEIKVHKVTVAMDPGISVNPDQVKAQCEGSVIMGMSAAMYEQMFVENGELQPVIYGPYQMALMKHAPKEIDVVLLQGIDKPGAVGEPPLGPIGAAVANAVFRLTGKRLTRLPLKLNS